jgi:hypothetical protein
MPIGWPSCWSLARICPFRPILLNWERFGSGYAYDNEADGRNMELSIKERLGFIYQLRILEALYPDEANHYANHRTALEEGYALHYDWIVEHLHEE